MVPRLNSSTRGVTRASNGSISFLASRSNSRAKKMKCCRLSCAAPFVVCVGNHGQRIGDGRVPGGGGGRNQGRGWAGGGSGLKRAEQSRGNIGRHSPFSRTNCRAYHSGETFPFVLIHALAKTANVAVFAHTCLDGVINPPNPCEYM